MTRENRTWRGKTEHDEGKRNMTRGNRTWLGETEHDEGETERDEGETERDEGKQNMTRENRTWRGKTERDEGKKSLCCFWTNKKPFITRISQNWISCSGIGPTYASKMTRNGIRITDLVDDFEAFSNKFTILADNYMAAFPSLQVKHITLCCWY